MRSIWNFNKKHNAIVYGATIAALTMATMPVSAQLIEEIVVTAQKREQSIQDVPISITAFSSDDLAKMNATGFEDIAHHTPGLVFGNFTDLKLGGTSLRGIVASSGSAGQDPAVGYYLDEIFLGPGVGANFDLFEIERIEILRGPQGTVFGRNTIGGVINIVSKAPPSEFSGNVEVEFGDYDHTRLRGVVGGPIVEGKFNASLSAMLFEHGGYTENVFLGEDVDDTERYGFRLALDFTPTDSLQISLNADYQNVEQHSKNFEVLSYNPAGLVTATLIANSLPLNTNPEDRRIYSNLLSEETLEAKGVSLKIVKSFDGIDLISVTGYRTHEYYNIGDTDVSPLDWAYDGDPEDVSRTSQEIRLASTGDQRFDWIVGGYYFHQDTDNLSFVTLGSDLSFALTGDPALLDGLTVGSSAQMEVDSYALFANVSMDMTERLELAIGGRYTIEEKSITYNQSDPLFLLGGTVVDLKDADDWNAFTPTLSLKYRWSDDVMSYLTISRGFKSGGYNDALGDATGISFDPETLWNYEAGFKSTLAGGRVTVNGAVYYMEWKDIQTSSDNPATPLVYDPITSNAGAAHSQGIELEFVAFITDDLRLSGFASFNETEFDEGTIPAAPPAIPKMLTKVPNAPEHQIGATLEYSTTLSSDYDLTLIGDLVHQGTNYLGLDTSDPDTEVDPYLLVNARVMIASSENGWAVSLWGKNLTDEVYRTRLFDLFTNPLVGQKFSVLGQPRTFGIELRMDF